MEPDQPVTERPFFPSGAIAFFVSLLLLYLVIWFTIFWIMIARG